MKCLVLSLLALLFAGSAARAGMLFSTPIGLGGSQLGRTDYITIPIASAIPDLGFWGPQIFATPHWTPADVGRTVVITDTSNPAFHMFSNALTDGRLEDFSFSIYPGPAMNESGYLLPEPLVIWGNENDPRIDLHGHVITGYSLTLDSLSITNAPNGSSSSFQASATFAAYDGNSVPEPSLTGLICLGCLACRRRRGIRIK